MTLNGIIEISRLIEAESERRKRALIAATERFEEKRKLSNDTGAILDGRLEMAKDAEREMKKRREEAEWFAREVYVPFKEIEWRGM